MLSSVDRRGVRTRARPPPMRFTIGHQRMTALIHVIGGGLAGCEAAWQIAAAGVSVVLHEMRPVRTTAAHQTDALAELVCSNSFRSDDSSTNAVGLIHYEMRRLNSLIMRAADLNQVPAGGALAVDRLGFSQAVSDAIAAVERVTIVREEIDEIPPDSWQHVIIATGPLTSEKLAQAVLKQTGESALAFFDAIAPIVYRDSINMEVAWRQSRYDKVGPAGTSADYINCPLDQNQYAAFVAALLNAPKADFKQWEKTPYFDGCLPIEIMAERGVETLRHGPLKPFGLTNSHRPDVKPYAVVQLRQDNALGTLYNMVGIQTKLRHAEQVALLRTIPGLEYAEFARLGGLHRNTFLNSPKLLDSQLRLKTMPRLRFAGQITGCEGYVESAAIGLIAGRLAAAETLGQPLAPPPPTTAIGALLNHITGGHIEVIDQGPPSFQPMNINFGLFPPLAATPTDGGRPQRGEDRGIARKKILSARAKVDLDRWLSALPAMP
jgi:methylenetetrahydrofolate--tRNA-(uracil-5-)-methyltransferase